MRWWRRSKLAETLSGRPWLRLGLLAIGLLAVVLVTLPITVTPSIRTRLAAALGERFDSDVEIQTLRVSALPRMRVEGQGVVLRHKGRTDVPPLITITSFSADATLFGLLTRPLRLKSVRLEGLEISVPAGGMDIDDSDHDEEDDDTRDSNEPDVTASADVDEETRDADEASSPLIVDNLVSANAVLRILRSEPEKQPRIFEIAHLSMQDTGANSPWPFAATLTNPKPPGEIQTRGTFGPWNARRPSQTPLDAEYEFRDADLGAFKGIRGILHSTGQFAGVLERIEVTGQTEVPDFALEHVGQAVPLTTQFDAIVDGTNGNTWLRPVDAQLIRSPILVNGGVVERDGEDGRTIALDAVMNGARIEDVLRLAVKSATPFMSGGLQLKTQVVLPPGDADPIDKLRLDGSFAIAAARFAKGTVQEKINELSQKASGDGDSDDPPDRVVSDFTGQFVMRNGVIRFTNLTFGVPGAKVNLAGRYTIRSEALDFRGEVRLDAKLSELTTGVKSFLLKLVDPLVRRKDVTVIPITVDGTADDPSLNVDFGRAFTP